MTPIWVFPVYPLLILAPMAAALINSVPTPYDTLRISSKTIIAGAITLQGCGFLVSALIYSAFLYRLMTNGAWTWSCNVLLYFARRCVAMPL